MYTPRNLARLNETLTLTQISELIREQELNQKQEKTVDKFRRTMKQARIEAKKAKRWSRH
jgi:3'-phosphoadenosine 5'-phosphosulfate sulfotransferase (PAPS reductase)/FAD synthetase